MCFYLKTKGPYLLEINLNNLVVWVDSFSLLFFRVGLGKTLYISSKKEIKKRDTTHHKVTRILVFKTKQKALVCANHFALTNILLLNNNPSSTNHQPIHLYRLFSFRLSFPNSG